MHLPESGYVIVHIVSLVLASTELWNFVQCTIFHSWRILLDTCTDAV